MIFNSLTPLINKPVEKIRLGVAGHCTPSQPASKEANVLVSGAGDGDVNGIYTFRGYNFYYYSISTFHDTTVRNPFYVKEDKPTPNYDPLQLDPSAPLIQNGQYTLAFGGTSWYLNGSVVHEYSGTATDDPTAAGFSIYPWDSKWWFTEIGPEYLPVPVITKSIALSPAIVQYSGNGIFEATPNERTDGASDFSYQWMISHDGGITVNEISEATERTYEANSGDIGSAIKVKIYQGGIFNSDVSYSNSLDVSEAGGSDPLDLTNVQKLSLPANTAVGTVVRVSDGFVVSGTPNDGDGFYFKLNADTYLLAGETDAANKGFIKDGGIWHYNMADYDIQAVGDTDYPWEADWSGGSLTLTHPAVQVYRPNRFPAVPSSMIAFWRFDETGEPIPPTLVDSVNGNNLDASGSASNLYSVPGQIGNGLFFSGLSTNVGAANDAFSTNGTDFTFWCWVKRITAGDVQWLAKLTNLDGTEWELKWIGDDHIIFGNGVDSVNSGSAVSSAGDWHLVVAWFSGGVWHLKIDNGATQTATFDAPTTSTDTALELAGGGGGFTLFAGAMDAVGYRAAAPSAGDLTELWNNGFGVEYFKAAMAVLGGTQDGIYTDRGSGASGKRYYDLLGTVSGGDSGDSNASEIDWNGSRWYFWDSEGNPLCYSLSDVATPDLAGTDKKSLWATNGTSGDNGRWTQSGMTSGRPSYALDINPDSQLYWTGSLWSYQIGGGDPIATNSDDVATPDLADQSHWISEADGVTPYPVNFANMAWWNAGDDSPASITVTNVSADELNAGLAITNDGITNGSSYVLQPFHGRQYYMGLNGGGSNNMHWDTDFSDWTDDVGLWTQANVAFPWQGTDDGDHHGATFARNDVASEANWTHV